MTTEEYKYQFLLYINPPASEKLIEPIEDELVQIVEDVISKGIKGSGDYSGSRLHLFQTDPQFKKHLDADPSLIEKIKHYDGSMYMGMHFTECGEKSACYDLLLENGMVTNTLSPFYLKWYRNSIPKEEMEKVYKLIEFYKNK
jgi:hypothetical protein